MNTIFDFQRKWIRQQAIILYKVYIKFPYI